MPSPVHFDISSLTTRTLDLWCSPSQQADRKNHLTELCKEARSGKPEAIELLCNLAVSTLALHGSEQGGNAIRAAEAAEATQILVDIASDPNSPDDARVLIQQFSSSAFQVSTFRKEGKGADRKSHVPSVHVPTPLLSLAVPALVKSNYAADLQKVNAEICARLEGYNGTDDRNFSRADRFCSAEEITSFLKFKEINTLDVEAQPIVVGEKETPGRLRGLAQDAIAKGRLQCFIIKQGAHWLAAIFGPSASDSGKADMVVYDSLHAPGDPTSVELKTMIEQVIPKETLSSYTHAGGHVQGATNGCGAFCARAIHELHKQRESGTIESMADVAKVLEADIDLLARWPKDKLEGVISGVRAEMLWSLEKAQQASRIDPHVVASQP